VVIAILAFPTPVFTRMLSSRLPSNEESEGCAVLACTLLWSCSWSSKYKSFPCSTAINETPANCNSFDRFCDFTPRSADWSVLWNTSVKWVIRFSQRCHRPREQRMKNVALSVVSESIFVQADLFAARSARFVSRDPLLYFLMPGISRASQVSNNNSLPRVWRLATDPSLNNLLSAASKGATRVALLTNNNCAPHTCDSSVVVRSRRRRFVEILDFTFFFVGKFAPTPQTAPRPPVLSPVAACGALRPNGWI